MTGSIDLVLLTGASFDRTVSDAQDEIRAPNSILALITVPASTHVVNHSVGFVAGVETRLAFGTHVRVMPGVRLQGASGGWVVRPAVAAGWSF